MTDFVDAIKDYLPTFQDGYISREEVAQGLVDLIIARIPPLVWGDEDRNGGFYCGLDLPAGFSAYYDIQQCDYDLAEVSYGISCHEFGETVIWKGPKSEAKAAANAHHVAQLCKGMGIE